VHRHHWRRRPPGAPSTSPWRSPNPSVRDPGAARLPQLSRLLGPRYRNATNAMTRSGHARTTPTAAHESRPCAEAPSSTAAPTPGAGALARRQPGGARIAGARNRGFGDHNAFRRGTRTATIEIVPSTTTPVTTARTAIPARRVHRAMRVRATNAPARKRASSDAR
jgi:hypothetical protein